MSKRSAEASIKGYSYQFLHTVKDIMERTSLSDICTVEGVEDFDIEKDSEKDLIQYKYHEEKKFINSRVSKPIALMFNHFIDNQTSNDKYKLFIHLSDDTLPSITRSKIIEILKLKTSTDYLDKEKNIYNTRTQEHHYIEDKVLIGSFIDRFDWVLTKKYDDLENELIEILSTSFSTSTEESEILFLSNAIKVISDLAIKPNGYRAIIKKQFIDKLKSYEQIIFSSLILKNKGFDKLNKFYKKQKGLLHVKKNSSNFVIHVNNISRVSLNKLIVELSKKFCFKGNRNFYIPITFVINCPIEEYITFKKSIFEYIMSQNELIKINDGYEDYNFNINVFNEPLIKTNTGNKYNVVSFNFKLLHQKNFTDNFSQMSFSNIGLFVLDKSNSALNYISEKQFYLNNLTNEQIIEIIGE